MQPLEIILVLLLAPLVILAWGAAIMMLKDFFEGDI